MPPRRAPKKVLDTLGALFGTGSPIARATKSVKRTVKRVKAAAAKKTKKKTPPKSCACRCGG